MKKLLLTKVMLAVALLGAGASDAWGADLTSSFEVSGYKKAHFYDFKTKDYDGTTWSSTSELSDLGFSTPSKTLQDSWASGVWYWSSGQGIRSNTSGYANINMTVDISENDYVIINGGAASESYEVTMTDGETVSISGAESWLCFKATKDMSTLVLRYHRYNYVSQILIMTVDEDASVAEYTINYKYNGETIAFDNAYETIGATVNAVSTKWIGGVKYLLDDSQTTSMTIVDGTNVLNVTVSVAPQYTYSINAIDENSVALGTAASNAQYSGETATTYYPKGYKKDGVWYLSAAKTEPYYGYSYTFTANKSQDVTYTKDADVTYCFEDSELTFTGGTSGAYPGRYSNGSAKRIAANGYAYSSALDNGVYTLIVYSRNNSGSAEVTLPVYIRNSDGTYTDTGKELTWAKGNANEQTVTGVEVPGGAAIAFHNTNDSYTSNAEIDYVVLKKTGDFTVSATIPTSTYGTIASAYALDCANLPTGVTAYKVSSLSASAVTLEAVTEAVAAGTGLILCGTAGETYNIPVVASGTDISASNKLKAAVTATTLDDGTFYILQSGKFCLVTGAADEAARTVPAGKAYLLASDVPNEARSLSFTFGDEATGISTTLMNKTAMNNEVYNLQGQRVAAPQKGLYIVNGKKVIVK